MLCVYVSVCMELYVYVCVGLGVWACVDVCVYYIHKYTYIFKCPPQTPSPFPKIITPHQSNNKPNIKHHQIIKQGMMQLLAYWGRYAVAYCALRSTTPGDECGG